jgi:hypothetical protein
MESADADVWAAAAERATADAAAVLCEGSTDADGWVAAAAQATADAAALLCEGSDESDVQAAAAAQATADAAALLCEGSDESDVLAELSAVFAEEAAPDHGKEHPAGIDWTNQYENESMARACPSLLPGRPSRSWGGDATSQASSNSPSSPISHTSVEESCREEVCEDAHRGAARTSHTSRITRISSNSDNSHTYGEESWRGWGT